MRKSRFLQKMVLAILLALTATVVVRAAEGDDIRVAVNGALIDFDGQTPVVVEGRTLVPARAVFAALGFEVYWDDNAQMVTLVGDHTIRLWIGADQMEVLGRGMMPLDVPAQLVGGRTMIPARAVAQAIGAEVDWQPMQNLVTIDMPTRDYRTMSAHEMLRLGYSLAQVQDIFEQEIFAMFYEWRIENGIIPFVADPHFAGTSRGWAQQSAGYWTDFDEGRIDAFRLNELLFGHTNAISANAQNWGRVYPLRSTTATSGFMTPLAAAANWLH